jgi:hypothetical protein
MNRPTCPKCGKTMTKGQKAQSGKLRWECRNAGVHCYSTTNPEATTVNTRSGSRKKAPLFKRKLGRKVTRVIVTAAQNATPVHKGFLASLETAANHLNAELLVIPLRYKNPTSKWTESQANEEVWAPEITPYLCNERKRLNKNLVVLGDVKTQPTAVSPLTGFEAITAGESGILGHTKLQLRSIPAPQKTMPKLLTTTGSCTVPNFTDSKAGKLGEFHYSLAAALVELDGRKFHLRQLNADKDTGNFTDLDTAYCTGFTLPANRARALIMGDTHVDSIDEDVDRATFGAGGMNEVLKPEYLVFHDLLDGYAVNPHHLGNPFIELAKSKTGRNDILAEIKRAAEFVMSRSGKVPAVIVPSNHNDMVHRYMLRTDWRDDPTNADFYLETAEYMAKNVGVGPKGTTYPDPFIYWMRKFCEKAPNVECLDTDESFMLEGVELGMHGDRGPNGARGSIRNLRRIGVKSVIGHSHSPGIDEGCYQTGTSTALRLEYNRGASSWLQTHCVLYASGKRSLINIIDGEWRL